MREIMVYTDQSLNDSRILIIDDNVDNILLLERLFECEGFLNYKSLRDPRLAVAVVEEYRPDLVLLDLHMPHIDGYGVLSQLRQAEEETALLPILIFTAESQGE